MSDVKAAHAELSDGHRESGKSYDDTRAAAHSAFQDLLHVDGRARRVLEDSGVETGGTQDGLAVNWYGDELSFHEQSIRDAATSPVWVGGGVASLIGAMGIQVGSWAVAGGFETGSATAAGWFGLESLSIEGFELSLAPFILSCICLVVGLVLFVRAYLVSRKRNRRVDRNLSGASVLMKEAIDRMDANGGKLRDLGNRAKDISEEISRATGAFQANRNQVTLDHIHVALDKARGIYTSAQVSLPHARLYLERPSAIGSLSSVEATINSVSIKWEDPDLGSTEIEGYRICQGGGFLRGERDLATVVETEFTHIGLDRGKTYAYRVIPINKLGEASGNRSFEARTQEA